MVADSLDKLVAMLLEGGFAVTREQAERMAVRIAGSVDAYIAELERTRARLKDYKPLDGPCSDKFSDPLSYEIEPAGQRRGP